MPRVSPIQETFNAGEISRSVRGRVSSEIYRAGLKSALNWMPIVQGPIRLRNGSKFLSTVDTSNWTPGNTSNVGIRTFTFSRGLGNDVLIEIGEGKVVPKDGNSGGDVIQGDTPNLIPNAQFSAGLDQWVWEKDPGFYRQNPNVTAAEPAIFGIFDILNPDAELEAIQAGTLDAYWNIANPAVGDQDCLKMGALRSGTSGINIPTGLENSTATLITRYGTDLDPVIQIQQQLGNDLSNWKWRVTVGSTPGGTDIFAQNFDLVIAENRTFLEKTVTFTPGVNVVYLSIGFTYIGPTDIPDTFFNWRGWIGVHELTIEVPAGTGLPIDFASPWNSAQLECLNYDFDPGEGIMIFTHRDVPTYYLAYNGGLWDFDRIDNHPDYKNPFPNSWIDGNWPGACAFHEGRLWLGGTNFDPATLWASRSGNYFDFDNNNPDAKDDPLLFPLSSAGNIQTLTSRKELVINTDVSEVIGDSTDGVIAFDDFFFPKQTDWGSNCIQPVVIGRQMLYTSNSKRIIRTFADEGGTNFGYDGIELNLLAEDIFRSPVRQMAFMDEPSYQAAFLLADGTLGMATFYYPENIIGWWRLKTAYNGSTTQTFNRVMSIAAVDTELGSKLWLTINRAGWAGTQYPTHELLSFDRDSAIALDSWVFRNISDAGVISDIDHLTDQDVSVVVQQQDDDGQVFYTVHQNPVTVSAGISSPLDEWAWGALAFIGLQYENNFQLLPVEGVSQRGTSQTTKRRWNQVYLRLNRGAIPLVDGEPAADRTPSTPMGRGEPIIDGDVEYSQLGSNKGELLITQDKPLITEVVAIFGKVAAEEI